MNLSIIEGTLFLATFLIPIILARRWEMPNNWCRGTGSGRLYEGDFNGDGRTDMLCHRTTDGYKWIAFADTGGEFTGTSWEGALKSCYALSAELYVGDFNGDGKDDLLCHDNYNGNKWIAHANSAGNFARGTTWQHAMGWCDDSDDQLHIGDFNGDGRDDMLCHGSNDGLMSIAYASGGGKFADGIGWVNPLGWCYSGEAELHIGDFNGDGRGDLLCHDSTNGYKRIEYANGDGSFALGTGWHEGIEWCYDNEDELHTGDVNGDGRDDLICHNNGNGYKWVAYANLAGNFHDGTSWEGNLRWCYRANAQFFVGDYNGDSRMDMLCHDTSNGKKWIIFNSAPPPPPPPPPPFE